MNWVTQLIQLYNDMWATRDTRVDSFPFMSSIMPVLILVSLYCVTVIYGPKWMRHRSPYNLKWSLFVYNLSNAILNYYIFKEMVTLTYQQGYNWWCQPIINSTEPAEMKIIATGYLYAVDKAIEFLDTVFIIARKKSNQLTFLHVYHHSTMLIVSWIVFRWAPGGSAALICLVNSLVHVIMHTYYSLSLLGPKVGKYLLWKRYLTLLQLSQFVVALVLGSKAFYDGCIYFIKLQYFGVFYALSFLILFLHFYATTYSDKKKKEQ